MLGMKRVLQDLIPVATPKLNWRGDAGQSFVCESGLQMLASLNPAAKAAVVASINALAATAAQIDREVCDGPTTGSAARWRPQRISSVGENLLPAAVT